MSSRIAHNRVSMIGKIFGDWEVLEFSHVHGKKAYYKCRCKCKNEVVVQGTNIRIGRSTKCTVCSKKETGEKSKGRIMTEEQKEKISLAKTGMPMSEETKEKLRGPRPEDCNQDMAKIDSSVKEGQRGLKISAIIRWKKANAIRRGKNWELTNLQVAELITKPCHYCGDKPITYHGLDRVDNNRGYEIDNVVTCCKYCNSAKLDKSEEVFQAWIDTLTAFQASKKQS